MRNFLLVLLLFPSAASAAQVTDTFAGTGNLIGYTTILGGTDDGSGVDTDNITSIGRVNGRYRAELVNSDFDATLFFNSSYGRGDYRSLTWPFEIIVRNVGVGTTTNSQIAATTGGQYAFCGIQVRNISNNDHAHVVIGHRGGYPDFGIETKQTISNTSTVEAEAGGAFTQARGDIRIVGSVGKDITVYYQNNGTAPDSWILMDGDGDLPGTDVTFDDTVYVGLITYADDFSTPFVGTADSIEMVGETVDDTMLYSDGSLIDVQDLVSNYAVDGDTVNIPAGTFTWSGGLAVAGKGITLLGRGARRVVGYSETSVSVGTGTKVLKLNASGLNIAEGATVRVDRTGGAMSTSGGGSVGARTYMEGTVTTYSGTTLTINITNTAGAGTHDLWMVAVYPTARTHIVHNYASGNVNRRLIELKGDASHASQLNGLEFSHGASSASGFLNATGSGTLLVCSNYFETNPNGGINVEMPNGVIWTNSFAAFPFADNGLAIRHTRPTFTTSWSTAHTMGSADTTGLNNFYIEQNSFHAYNNAIDGDDNTRLVFRRNWCNNSGIVVHGADTSAWGARHYEIIDNIWTFKGYSNGQTFNLNRWFYVRGGTGVFTGNTVPDLTSGDYPDKPELELVTQNITRNDGSNPCWGAGDGGDPDWPSPRQVGRGWIDGAERNDPNGRPKGDLDPLHVWGNTGTVDVVPDTENFGECDDNDEPADYLIVDRDWVTTARSGYVAYTFPHHLTGLDEEGGVDSVTGDTTFNPAVEGAVTALAVQSDGKVVVGGSFTSLGGHPRSNLGRLNADGSLDPSFNAGANGSVTSLIIQPDGKTLVGGNFSTLAGATRYGVGRLNADSSIDTAFAPVLDGIADTLVLQADGKILVAGGFTTVDGQLRINLARLNANGTLDTAFRRDIEGGIWCLALQANGSILVGGSFSIDVGGDTYFNMVRLSSSGSVDANFYPDADGPIDCILVQPDGRILISGGFSVLDSSNSAFSCAGLGRIDGNGNPDTSFNPAQNGQVASMVLQADGKIILGGSFTSLVDQQRNGLGRVNANGTIDNTFVPNTDGPVESLATQGDGKILVGGGFTTLGGQPRNGLGRLTPTIAPRQSLTYAEATITWSRGGTRPEAWRTTFESSIDGSSWTDVGAGTRTPGGWQLTGATLPENTFVRARGFVSGGYQNGSSWFVESLIYPNTPIYLNAVRVGGSLELNWTESPGYFQVQQATNLTAPIIWQDFGAPVTEHSLLVPIEAGKSFWRVRRP